MAHIVKPGDTSQKQPISILDVVGFFVDLAMFLPRNKTDIPPAFRKLLEEEGVTQAGTNYIRRIDHQHALSDSDCAILAEEGTYYLLLLQYCYSAQMGADTAWQSNVAPDDPRTKGSPDIITFIENRLEICLQALGVPAEYAHEAQIRYDNESGRYNHKLIWQYAARDNSLYPTFMKAMRRNARKRMVMNEAKLEVVDKYSDKIHSVARKFFKKFYRNYRFVGIRHFDDV
jgi:hypothetical protein